MEYKIITLTRLKDFLTEAKYFFAEKVHKHTVSEITDFPSSLPANGGNATTVNGHAVNADVPLNAKFTDTDTWRGIQNNLTSTSTTDSLSAAQGKILDDKITNLKNNVTTVTIVRW